MHTSQDTFSQYLLICSKSCVLSLGVFIAIDSTAPYIWEISLSETLTVLSYDLKLGQQVVKICPKNCDSGNYVFRRQHILFYTQ